jgi:hypothetical protein
MSSVNLVVKLSQIIVLSFLVTGASFAMHQGEVGLQDFISSIGAREIKDISESFKGDLHEEAFLRKAFERAIKDGKIEHPENFKIYFSPSKKAVDNYISSYKQRYRDGKQKPCKNLLACKNMKDCSYQHFMYGVFHSTDNNSVKSIFDNGFIASASSKSMGSGVYFTTSMRNNNNGAYEKSHAYGEVVIVALVIPHAGVHEVKANEPWTSAAQEWLQGGADIKFMREGVKSSDPHSKEFAGENVVRDAEKIIPLGIIYPSNIKNPITN